ncbi:MAG TPA: ribonuclease D [Anaerolineae bacterium]|nr:ribonuclease D [Anaerolineae bacterium]
MSPPMLVKRRKDLAPLIDALSKEPRIAVDTESNSLFAYKESVCLIQFSIPGKDFLLDSVTLADIAPLGDVFSDPNIEKVLHGAEYDVVSLKRDFGFHLNNLFDTRMAIRTLGGNDTSLEKLLAKEFGVILNKRYQRANWGKRPLKAEMLDYARMDTHFLLPLREKLGNALHEAGRWEEASEACVFISQLQPTSTDFNQQGFWNIHHARKLNPKQAAVLRELWNFRDEVARKRNVPVFKVLEDKVLLAIAEAMPRNQADLNAIPALTQGLFRRYAERILDVVERGSEAPPAHPPRNKRLPDEVRFRYEHLRQWRKEIAEKRGVPSDIILPRDFLWQIALHPPENLQQLGEMLSPLEWRFKQYGSDILTLLG